MAAPYRGRQTHNYSGHGNERGRDDGGGRRRESVIPYRKGDPGNGPGGKAPSESTYRGPVWGHPVDQERLMKEVGLPTGMHPTNAHTVDTNKWSYENIHPCLLSFVFNTAKPGTLHPYEDESYNLRRGIAIVPTLSRTRAGKQIPRGQLPYSQRTISPDYTSPDEDAHSSRRGYKRDRRHHRRRRDEETDSVSGGSEDDDPRDRRQPGLSSRNANGYARDRHNYGGDRRRLGDVNNDRDARQRHDHSSDRRRQQQGRESQRVRGESSDDRNEQDSYSGDLSRDGEDGNNGARRRRETSPTAGGGRQPHREAPDNESDNESSDEQDGEEGDGGGVERDRRSSAHREPNVSQELKERYRRAVEAKEAQTKETQIRRYLKLHRDCARAGFEPIAQLSDPRKEDIPRLQKCIREMEAELEKHKFVENRIGSVRTGAGILVALNRSLGNVIPLEEPESANGESGGGGGFMDMVKQVTEECRDDFDELFDMQVQQKGSIRAVQGHPLVAMGSKFLQRCSSHYLWSKYGIDTSDPIATSMETFRRSGRSEDDVYRTRHESGNGAGDEPIAAKAGHAAQQDTRVKSGRGGASTASSSSAPQTGSARASSSSGHNEPSDDAGNAGSKGGNSKAPAIANRNRPSDANAPPASSSAASSSSGADADNTRRQGAKASSSNDPSSSSTTTTTTARTTKSKQALHSGVNLDGNGLPVNNTHALMEKQASKANVMKSVNAYAAL